MSWPTGLGWMLKCLFVCNHARTAVSEGKCYCPDCGCGLIIRWVVLRCTECRTRRDTRYHFRRVAPAQRCCAYCGTADYKIEVLDSPSYFQVQKARLLIEEDADTRDYFALCLEWLFGPAFKHVLHEAVSQTRAWLEPPTYALSPVPAETR